MFDVFPFPFFFFFLCCKTKAKIPVLNVLAGEKRGRERTSGGNSLFCQTHSGSTYDNTGTRGNAKMSAGS